jgi:hypothetical protein
MTVIIQRDAGKIVRIEASGPLDIAVIDLDPDTDDCLIDEDGRRYEVSYPTVLNVGFRAGAEYARLTQALMARSRAANAADHDGRAGA